MVGPKTDKLDQIHDWFDKRRSLWTVSSVCSLITLFCLWISVAFLEPASLVIRPAATIIAIPLVILAVLGISWRGSIPMFLSFAGGACAYFPFYIYARFDDLQYLPPLVTNKLGVGRLVMHQSPDATANLYLLTGIFAFSLALVLAYKPSIFWAKGSRIGKTYPRWNSSIDQKSALSSSVMLVPVQGLLSYAERHLSAKYAYLLLLIGNKKYFVAPDEWVPQGTFVLRDRRSGSLLGIPKVPDGFNA